MQGETRGGVTKGDRPESRTLQWGSAQNTLTRSTPAHHTGFRPDDRTAYLPTVCNIVQLLLTCMVSMSCKVGSVAVGAQSRPVARACCSVSCSTVLVLHLMPCVYVCVCGAFTQQLL